MGFLWGMTIDRAKYALKWRVNGLDRGRSRGIALRERAVVTAVIGPHAIRVIATLAVALTRRLCGTGADVVVVLDATARAKVVGRGGAVAQGPTADEAATGA